MFSLGLLWFYTLKEKISEKSITLFEGSTYQLNILKSQGSVIWTSTDNDIVRINKNGYIQARKTGDVYVSAKIKNETYKCKVAVVPCLSNDDFNYDKPNSNGYLNYIDYYLDGHASKYRYFNKYYGVTENRGIEIGDTYNDVVSKYGNSKLLKVSQVSMPSNHREHFYNSVYPRTVMQYKYRDQYLASNIYKTFYFDANGTLILIVWDNQIVSRLEVLWKKY